MYNFIISTITNMSTNIFIFLSFFVINDYCCINKTIKNRVPTTIPSQELYQTILNLLPLNPKGLCNSLFRFLTLVAAIDNITDRGVGDAQAFCQLLLRNILLNHCNFHFLSKWGTWDSHCHIFLPPLPDLPGRKSFYCASD